MNTMGTLALIFITVAWLTGITLKLIGSGFWRVGKRLDSINQDTKANRQDHSGERTDNFPLLSSALKRSNRYSTLKRSLERAGLNWQPGEFLAAWTVGIFALGAAGWLLLGLLGLAIGILLAVVCGVFTLKALQDRRLHQFENQLPDALMLIASSLRSGYGLLRSIQAIQDEMKPPIATEFGKVLDETALGLGVQDALRHLLLRVPLPDLKIAVTAIIIHLDIGGNLAEIIEIVAATVRERQRIRAEVQTLTAEGRISGVILFILPIAMAFVLVFINPSYMSGLFQTSFGHFLIYFAVVLQVIGGLVIKNVLKFDF